MSISLNILCVICINHTTLEIMLHLTRMHGFCSIFTQHTLKKHRSLAHTASPDKIQDGHPVL